MATVKFYLKNPKSNTSSIFFRLNYGAFELANGKKRYLPLQYQVDETINPAYWNTKKGEAKQTNRFSQYPEFNARLNSIRDAVLTLYRKLQNDGKIPSNTLLRKELDAIFKKHKNQTEVNSAMELMSFIPFYIETSNKAPGTKKGYKLLQTNLEDYEDVFKVKLTFDRIDIDFYNSFIKFLQSKKYTPNTVGGRIKTLKVFMNEAYERGLHKNIDYTKKAFSRPAEETKSIYLNENELQALLKLDLSGNQKYEHVRDWFLIGAYSGLRFSDLARLTEDNIFDDRLEITTEKTGKKVIIPINQIIQSILEKYDYKLPKIISNQKFNEYIKEVAQKAEITKPLWIGNP